MPNQNQKQKRNTRGVNSYKTRLYYAALKTHLIPLLDANPIMTDTQLAAALTANEVPATAQIVGNVRKIYCIPNYWQRLRQHRQAAKHMINNQPLEV